MFRNLFDWQAGSTSRKNRAERKRPQQRQEFMRPLRHEPLEDRLLLTMVLDFEDEIGPGAIMQRTIVVGDGGDKGGGIENLGGNGLEFDFNPATGTPQNVIDGFAEAGEIWSRLLTDDIMVNIDISFPSLGSGILGSTSIEAIDFTYTAARQALVDDSTSLDDATAVANLPAAPDLDIYINRTDDNPNGSGSPIAYVDDDGGANNTTAHLSRANAKALGLVTAGNVALDASIAFSSDFAWDFDRSDGISASAYDFVGVAAHEIGHALGFVSGVDVLDINSPPINGPFNDDSFTFVGPLDFYRYSVESEANNAIDWTADARDKFLSLDAGATFLTQFAEGDNFGDGDQASHWKDDLGLGMMDPTLDTGEYSDITANDVQAFDVTGWDLETDVDWDVNDSGNNILLRLNAADTGVLELLVDGTLVQSFAVASLASLTINGLGGDDTLTVDQDNGLITVPITFNGGADTDTLQHVGDPGIAMTGVYNTDTQDASGNRGEIVYNGGTSTITFTGLEPVIDLVPALSLTVNDAAGADVINIVDGPIANDTYEVNFGGAAELIQFRNKDALVVNGLGGDDVITHSVGARTTADSLASITINGDAGEDDIVILRSTINASMTAVTVNGGANDDDIELYPSNGATDTLIPEEVIVSGDGGTDTLLVDDTLNPFNDTWTVTASTLDRIFFGGATYNTTIESLELRSQNIAGSTVNVNSTSVPTLVDTGAGDDTVNISFIGGDLTAIVGDLDLDLGTATDEIVVWDDLIVADAAYLIEPTQITGANPGAITYDDTAELLTLEAGGGADTIDVVPSVDTEYTINGNDPVFFTDPGDTMTVDLAGTTDATVIITGPGDGRFTFTSAHQDVNFTSIETVDAINGEFDLVVDGTAGDDDYRVALDTTGNNIQLFLGGNLIFNAPSIVVSSLTINGLEGDDSLTVDGENGLPTFLGAVPSGQDNPNILEVPGLLFAGGDDDDTVIFEDLAADFDQTYAVGDGVGGGFGVGTSEGEILTEIGAVSLTLYFTGLEPALNTSTGGGTLTVIGDNLVNLFQVVQSPLIAGGTRVQEVFGPYESFDFAPDAFTDLVVFGHDSTDSIELVDIGALETALASVTFDGRRQDLGDDGLFDFFQVYANELVAGGGSVGVPVQLNGGEGDDIYYIYDLFTNDVDRIIGPVNVDGIADNDTLIVRDTGSAGPSEVVDITATTIDGITGLGGGGGTINYVNLDAGDVLISANDAGHEFNVFSTAAGLNETELNTGDGIDTININDGADTANGVVSPIDLNAQGEDDTLNIVDTADGADNVYHMDATDIGGGAFGAAVATGGIFGAGGILTYDGNLEAIDVDAGDGANEFNIDATGVGGTAPEARVTIDDGAVSSVFNIQANQLAADADHTFNGNDAPDAFNVHLADGTVVTGNSVQINGQADNGDTDSRDIVEIIDEGGARVTTLTYQSAASGDVDVQIDAGTLLDVNTVEQLQYTGDTDNDDAVTVLGTTGDDDLTIAPQTDSEALIFLNGNPWDGPIDPDSYDQALPGIAGGGSGPDMRYLGIERTGLTVDGNGAGAAGDQLYVYAPTEEDIADAGMTTDPFDFDTGVIIPGVGVGNAYDDITMSDALVTIDNVLLGPLVDVNINTASFVQVADDTVSGLIVNSGFEDDPAGNGIADDIAAVLSYEFALKVNGGDPVPAFAPDGDRLNVITPGEINVFSDKEDPLQVTITTTNPDTGEESKDLTWSSIENVILTPGLTSQTVNLIGDNNDPEVDQNDNFVVVGADVDSTLIPLAVLAGNPAYNPTGAVVHPDFDVDTDGDNEFVLVINGSAPIGFRNVVFLNAYGDDQNPPPGEPSEGPDHIDTLEITPYADATPTGWGIDVRFDEGNPVQDDGLQADLLIYNTSVNANVVSEDIVIQPAGPESGELRVTNGAFGTPIVTISYVNNLDIIVNDDDGNTSDTDTLTLRGTNPDNEQTSGRELVTANFANDGTLIEPLVIVRDLENFITPILYRVRDIVGFDTVTMDTLGGLDIVEVTGRDDGSLAINVDNGDVLQLPGTVDDTDIFIILPGSTDDSGTALVRTGPATNLTEIQFNGSSRIQIDGGGGTSIDQVTLQGTGADNAFTVEGVAVLAGNAQVDAGPIVSFSALGSDGSLLVLDGGGGDDDFSVEHTTNWQMGSIIVDGGTPATGSDSVEILGTGGDDEFSYMPASDSAGTVSVTSGGSTTNYILSDVEQLTVGGEGGGDELTVVTPAGLDYVTFTPVSPTTSDLAIAQLLGVTFQAIDDSSIVLEDAAQERADLLAYNATPIDDSVAIVPTGEISMANPSGEFHPILADGIQQVTVNGLEGHDSFLAGGENVIPTVKFQGGDSDELDSLLLTGPSAPVVVNIGPQVVVGYGGLIYYDGIADLVVSANDPVTVSGSTDDDHFVVTPMSDTEGTVRANGVNPLISYSGSDTVNIDGNFGADSLTVVGSSEADAIVVDATSVTTRGIVTFNTTVAGVEALTVLGLAGSDEFDVTPGAIPVFIDGGDPIGMGDKLILNADTSSIFSPGPESDEGMFVIDDQAPVSFDHIEAVEVSDPGGNDLIAVAMGTSADDEITAVGVTVGTVDVSYNAGPTVRYSGVAIVQLDGKHGDDDITIDAAIGGLGVQFDVIGGLATVAGDRLRVTGVDGVFDDPTWTPNSGSGGQLDLGGQDPITVTGVEELIYDGEADAEFLTVAASGRFVHTPGTAIDAGQVAVETAFGLNLLPIDYVNMSNGGRIIVDGSGGEDALVSLATDGSDAVGVIFPAADLAVIGLTSPIGGHIIVETRTVENYEVWTLGGDDTVNVSAPVLASGLFAVVGGADGTSTDTLNLLGEFGTDEDVLIRPDATVSGAQDVEGLGTRIDVDGMELITYRGNFVPDEGGDPDDALVVDLGPGDNAARVEAGNGVDLVTSDSLPDIEFQGVASFTVDGNLGSDIVTYKTWFLSGARPDSYEYTGIGTDTLVIEGSDGQVADALTITNPDNGAVAVTDGKGAGVTVTALTPVHLRVDTLGGDDQITVDVDGTPLIGGVITVDGGSNSDTLRMLGQATGGQQNPVDVDGVYRPGPVLEDGRLQYFGPDATMTIDFTGLEPIIDIIPGTLTVLGTPADNAINYEPGLLGGFGRVTVDAYELIEFSLKTALTIDALPGSDVVDLNNPTAPIGLTAITVLGSDDTAGDVVIVNGTTGADVITFTPVADDGAVLAGVQGVTTVTVGTTESVMINGLGGNDILNVATGAGDNTIELTPGATGDAGDVQVDSLVPMSFTNLGAGGTFVALDSDGADNDTFIYNGTPGSDAFTVASATVFLNARIPASTVDVESYKLRGLGGEDAFTILAQESIDILVEGDEPAMRDTLNFARDVNGDDQVIVELDSDLPGTPFLQTIEQVGYGVVTHTGVETVNMDLEDGELYVAGTRGDDVITFTPLSEDSGVLTADHIPSTYYIDDVPAANPLVITGGGTGRGGPLGGGFADKVIYQGTDGSDLIRVDAPNRTVALDILGFGFPATVLASWRSITLDDNTTAYGTSGTIEVVAAESRDGHDTIYVVPAAPVGNGLFVQVDGGSPQASDALVITDLDGGGDPVPLSADDFVVVGQSRNPDAGNILVYQSAVRRPGIAYENVEVVSPNVASGDNLLILGPDMYEQNEWVQTAAYLGAGETLNVENLAIFPNVNEHPGVPADLDYFRVVAQKTGTLDFQVYFHMYPETLLPAGGDLDIEVLDAAGNVIAGDGDFGDHDITPNARVRIPAVAGQTYYLSVFGAADQDGEVVNGYDLTVINTAPPVPYDIELLDLPVDPDYDCTVDPPADNSDTGRSHFDNVTCDASPTIIVRLDDSIFRHDLPGNGDDDSPPDQIIRIPFNATTDPADATDPGYRVAIYVEGDPQQPNVSPQTVIGYAIEDTEEGVYRFDFGDAIVADAEVLTDGSHFISARVEMIDPAVETQYGYGERSESLEIVVDTIVPEIELLDMVDDGMCAYAPDNVTNDTTPSFYGYAEANSIMRIYVDLNDNGTLEIADDQLLGEAVAIPYDGNNQFPNGYYTFTTPIDLNDPVLGLELDGLRTIFGTAEDLAGNVTPEEDAEVLRIFLDTQGPQITDVYLTDFEDYDLFDPKPSTSGPTPLVDSISIDVRDLPARVAPEFLYAALVEEIAEHPGHYHVVGDANGIIPIERINFIGDPNIVDGEIATGTIILTFADPLPDDRYTLTVSDSLIDPACNNLDGESNADEPHEDPLFPTGDGVPGGDFIGRFTIDSRPEVGVWAAGNIWVDTNGNGSFDPDNLDYTNRDIVYQMGFTSDDIFAGNFAEDFGDTADGFDKLALYGKVNGSWRWLVDTDNNGVPNIELVDPLAINGLPVAGRFDVRDANGDEVGVFTGDTWYFDRTHDYRLDADTALPTAMRGYPVVGDFDRDGFDDLATWTDDTFQVDLANGALRGWDGVADETFRFGSIGVRQRPVVADMDEDGFDDFGLWMPDRSGVLPRSSGEWNFLISTDPETGVDISVLDRIRTDPITGVDVVDFTPIPFGPDMFIQFGDDFALPVVGNFDPPVTGGGGGGGGGTGGNLHTNLDEPLDVNADGFISPIDALIPINHLNAHGSHRLLGQATGAPYLDVNMDGFISPVDSLRVINYLNSAGSGEGEAEGELAVAAPVQEVGTSEMIGGATQTSLVGSIPAGDALISTGYVAAPTTVTAAGQPVATDYLPVGADGSADDEALQEYLQAAGRVELAESLELDDVLTQLAIGEDDADAVDEIFGEWGDA